MSADMRHAVGFLLVTAVMLASAALLGVRSFLGVALLVIAGQMCHPKSRGGIFS